MFAITFHHLIVGIASGTGILMGICALLAWLGNFVSNLDDFQQSFDKTSLLSSILCLICMPLAIFSGTYATSDPGGIAILYNKFVFSGLAIGFTASFIVGRVRFGENIWNDFKLSTLQMICASGAMFWIIITGSIGGKISIGESVMDIMPFWPDFTSTIVLPWWVSMVMLVFGIASIVVALKLGPTVKKISD